MQPWPELGDSPLEYELDALREGSPMRLGARALKCIELDGAARAEGVSLFAGLSIPRSHATLTEKVEGRTNLWVLKFEVRCC